MLKALVVAALGGIVSGRFVRNGWHALFLVIALISAETAVEGSRHLWSGRHEAGIFALLDSVGSGALLVGAVLSV